MIHDAVVVGSGPAGVAAASALLRRGRRVLMLDAGLQLEPERREVVTRLASTGPTAWDPRHLELVKQGMEPGSEGIPLKRLFGSDFPFRETGRFAEIECRESDSKMSLALGGLSNVWGAGMIPFSAADIQDWPLSISELAPFYRECFEETDLAATEDDLACDYPLFTDRAWPLRPSRQAEGFLSDLRRHREPLRREGILFGGSRLGVRAPAGEQSPGCRYCGLCLYGCPYGLIYNSADAVASFKTHPHFRYEPQVIVERVEEKEGSVTLHARHFQSGSPVQFTASQAFLACGTISSTAILMESLGAWDEPVQMKDSQYFLCPAVRFRGTRDVETEPLHTLAQAFLEINDPKLSARGIQISVYSYNDLLLVALRKQAGIIGRIFPGLPRALAARTLVFGGYLHSEESPGLEFRLQRAEPGGRRVILQGLEKPSSARIVNRLMRKLVKNSLRLRALTLAPLARKGLPGRGFHTGGSFPMSTVSAEFRSDLMGRPQGFSRLHVVDATVFPSIPAPNLTLTVMANARRIAAEASKGYRP